MKYKILIAFLFLGLLSFAQNKNNKIEAPNYVEKKQVRFYKNSWKPFTGNILLRAESPKKTTLVKIENGFEVLTEIYNQKNRLVQKLQNGIEVKMDSLNRKSEFSPTTPYTDTINLKHSYVFISYKKDSQTGATEKFSGILKSDNTKIFYEAGMKVKIEHYFDKDCNKIKESFEIFHTELGNLEFKKEELSYDGKYKIWDISGKLIDQGTYDFGQKVKNSN